MNQPEILTALITPFTQDGAIDNEGFRGNLQHLEPLVDGVFVAGTTGKFLALSAAEHADLVTACLGTFGPARTVVHVGAPTTATSVALASESRRLGAERFAALTPYYLPASTQGVIRHWAAIKEACEGELYGYIYPDVAVTDVLPEQLGEVLASGISGVKVSATASARVTEYLANAPAGFKLWSGNDADVPAVMAAGGTGSVSGVSGACPTPWAVLRDAMGRGDEAAAARAQDVIRRVVPVLGPSIANLKRALDIQGRAGGTCRMVIDQPGPDVRTRIDEVVELAAQLGATS